MNRFNRFAAVAALFALAACDDPAKVARENLIRAADNFEVNRRITFVNGMTNQSMLVIEGYCSLTIRPEALKSSARPAEKASSATISDFLRRSLMSPSRLTPRLQALTCIA